MVPVDLPLRTPEYAARMVFIAGALFGWRGRPAERKSQMFACCQVVKRRPHSSSVSTVFSCGTLSRRAGIKSVRGGATELEPGAGKGISCAPWRPDLRRPLCSATRSSVTGWPQAERRCFVSLGFYEQSHVGQAEQNIKPVLTTSVASPHHHVCACQARSRCTPQSLLIWLCLCVSGGRTVCTSLGNFLNPHCTWCSIIGVWVHVSLELLNVKTVYEHVWKGECPLGEETDKKSVTNYNL